MFPLEEVLRSSIQVNFPTPFRQIVEEQVRSFSPGNARQRLLAYFIEANKVNMLAEAVGFFEAQSSEHWAFQPPESRGSLNIKRDLQNLEDLYRNVGLEPPEF